MASESPEPNGKYTIVRLHSTMHLAFGVAVSVSCCQGSETASGMFMSLQTRNKTSPSIFSLSNSYNVGVTGKAGASILYLKMKATE